MIGASGNGAGVPEGRLARQLMFVLEVDKAKSVLRQTPLTDGSRREDDGGHMWHFALAASVLAEHAREPVDIGRVVLMALVHDIVEIDAGDVIVYDTAAREAQKAREAAAAERIFGLLPPDQATLLRGAWEEFEARTTPEARFAAAVDRLLPIMLNHAASGAPWIAHAISAEAAFERNALMDDGAPALWEAARDLLDEAAAKGWLA